MLNEYHVKIICKENWGMGEEYQGVITHWLVKVYRPEHRSRLELTRRKDGFRYHNRIGN